MSRLQEEAHGPDRDGAEEELASGLFRLRQMFAKSTRQRRVHGAKQQAILQGLLS